MTTQTTYKTAAGEIGWFDLDEAQHVADDALRWDGQNHTSRATGSAFARETLFLTSNGAWVILLDNRDGRHGAGVGESWHGIPSDEAELWLRRQGLHEFADKHFGRSVERIPPSIAGIADDPRVCGGEGPTLSQT